VEVADDQLAGPEDPVRRPTMTVEDPDLVPHDPRRGVDYDLARQVARQADIVVPQHDFDLDPCLEQGREEVEDHRAERWRSADDRVLHVAGDHDATSVRGLREVHESFREPRGRRLGGSGRAVGARSETQVEVREEEARHAIRLGLEPEDRGARERSETHDHRPAERGEGLDDSGPRRARSSREGRP